MNIAIAKSSFYNQTLIKSILVGFTFWGFLSSDCKAIAETPKVFTDSTLLSVGFDECKQKAIFAASSMLDDVTTAKTRNLRFKVTGINKNTVTVIYCIERDRGTIAIITTSTCGKQHQEEAHFIYDRLTKLITLNK